MTHTKLPYVTISHEFYIEHEGSTARIICKAETDEEAISNPITYDEFRVMIHTAAIEGIKTIQLAINYSIEVHSKNMKDIGSMHGVKIERI